MATKLTDECKAGYDAPTARNPYLFSSDSNLAFTAGQRLSGISGIKSCMKSRGYSVRIESTAGTKYLVTFRGDLLDDVIVARA